MEYTDITKTITSIFVGKDSLLDCHLDEIHINTDSLGKVQILLTFSKFRKKSKFDVVKLLFQDIIEFGFYHNKRHHFYFVQRLKLLTVDSNIYLSMDTDEKIKGISENDNDFIYACKVSVFIKNRYVF